MSFRERVLRSRFAWALASAVLALLLGATFVYPRQWTRGFLINDEAWYAEPARNIAEGRGFVTKTLYPMFAREVASLPMEEPFKQVGFALVAAWTSRATGFINDQLFVAIALVGLALTGAATWLLTSTLLQGRAKGAAVTVATIGNPVFLAYWTAALPESIFTALFLLGLWLLLARSALSRLGAGVLLTVSVYFKGFAVIYLPLAFVFVAMEQAGRRVGQCLWFAGGIALALGLATSALPSATGQVSSASSRYAGSMLLFETRRASPAVEGPFYDITPPEPLAYILNHPFEYAEKVARMVSRTKGIVEELGGPSFGGVLLPILLFIAVSVAIDLAGRVRRHRPSGDVRPEEGNRPAVRLLLAGLIAVNFAFFWAGNFKARYFAHLFPLMLAAAVLELESLVPRARAWYRSAPRPLLAVAIGYFLVLPPAVGVWKAYRDPHAYLGRMLAGRWADYREVAATVEANVPEREMVMTDMAHEISWYTDRPTVFFPGDEDQVEFLLDKFAVKALYEHPRSSRDWATLRARFKLVDDRNGRFWIRRD